MIKYFKNGVLQAETQDVPQDCGKIKVTVSLEEELEGVNYFLEFSCPRNVKYISQKLVRVADKEYEVILPRGITEYTGEVYVQLVIMSIAEERLLSRSLIARDPLFVIKESILASVALDNENKQDFFDYALTVVGKAENAIDDMENKIENIPEIVGDKVNQTLEIVDKTMSDYKEKLDEEIVEVNGTLGEHATTIGEHEEKIADLVGNVIKKENILQEFNGVTDSVYSADYINKNFGKKITKNYGSGSYKTTSGLAKMFTITIPVSGMLWLTVWTSYGMTQVKKLAIMSKKFDYKNYAVSDANANDYVATTLCCNVTAGEVFDVLVEANTTNSTNAYDYEYVILEE